MIDQADDIIEAETLGGGANRPMTRQEKTFAAAVRELHTDYRISLGGLSDATWGSGDANLISQMRDAEELTGRLGEAVDPTMRQWITAGGNAGLRDANVQLFAWVQRPEVQEEISSAAFKFAERYGESVVTEMRDLISTGIADGDSIPQLKKRVENRFVQWQGYKAERVARTESVDKINRGKEIAYRSTDGLITEKVWDASGDACPFCMAMHGRVMAIGEPYFSVGDTFSVNWDSPDGPKTLDMKFTYNDIRHPPIHPNCRCTIIGRSNI